MTEEEIWRKALERIDAKEQEKAQEAAQEATRRINAFAERERLIQEDINQLTAFMKSREGNTALSLLKALDRSIILGSYREDSEYSEGYLLMNNTDGRGLFKEEIHGSAMSAAYGGSSPKVKYVGISESQAVRAAVKYGDYKPGTVTSSIRQRITEMANSIK